MAYRDLKAQPQAQADFDAFIEELATKFSQDKTDPNLIVRDALHCLYFGGCSSPTSADLEKLPLASRVVFHTLDPRNITTEPEYYSDIDSKLYAARKPYIWLWQMFDRSPVGQNAVVGHRLRRMLAPLIFRRVGANFKCWHYVEWSFGYNLSFGDNVVIHRHVLLDDRGGIEVGNNVSISDYANVYSHHHDIYDIEKVSTSVTRIGNSVRLTYQSTVLSGVTIGDNALVGTGAVVTKDVETNHIVTGIPARTVKVK